MRRGPEYEKILPVAREGIVGRVITRTEELP